MSHTHRLTLAAAIAASLAAAGTAGAFDADTLTLRARGIHVEPAEKNAPINASGVRQNGLDLKDKWGADLDLEYALTPNFGVELALPTTQKQTVTARQSILGNNVDLGGFTQWLPTLTGKYYFLTERFRPYVGAGVTVARFSGNSLSAPALGALDIDHTSLGTALQAGFDVNLNRNWSLSFDAKKLWADTELRQGGTRLTTLDVNPWVFGLGVGYRFGKPAPVPVAAPPPAPAPKPAVAPQPLPVAPPPPAPPKDSDGDGVPDTADACPNTPAGAKVDARGCEIVLTLKGVNFEFNSAKLTPESTAILDQAAAVLKQRPNAKVEVQGHTDAVGADAYNLKLSEARATSVRKYLVDAGVPAGMLAAKGYGESQPVAPNATKEGRAQNRRVDLKFAQ